MVNIFFYIRLLEFFFLQFRLDQQSYDKEHLNSTQPNKDTHLTSKLSPTAVAFSQGVPSTTALYINPIPFPMPSYYHPHHPSTSGLSMENHVSLIL